MPASACGVYIRTWGTTDEEEEYSFLSTRFLRGIEIGHASLEIIIPDTKENWGMVQHILGETGIPFVREKNEVKKIFYPDGNPVFSDENAYEEDVIKIYFSWWPNEETDKNFSFQNLEEDLISERFTTSVEYKPEWEDYLEPERRYREWILAKVITLPPREALHFRGATEPEIALLKSYHFLNKATQDMQAFQLFMDKLRTYIPHVISYTDLSPTEKLLLKQFMPDLLDKGFYIQPNALVNALTSCAEKLTNRHDIAYAQFHRTLEEVNVQEQEELQQITNRLKEKKLLSAPEKKKINSVLSKHGLNSNASFDKVNAFFNMRQSNQAEAQELLKRLKPQIETFKKELADLKEQITKDKQIIQEIQYFNNLENRLKNQPEQAALLARRKEMLIQKLQKYDKYIDPNINIFTIMVDIDRNLTTRKSQKKELKQRLVELTEKEEQAEQAIHALAYTYLNYLTAKHITQGQLPDHTISLGLKKGEGFGLDAEKMLQQMAAIVQNNPQFSLLGTNCSHMVCEILAAGAGNKFKFFKQRAFSGTLATPQIVYNNVMQYSRSFNENIEPKEMANENSWQNYFASTALSQFKQALSPEASYFTRGLRSLTGLSAAATSATIENATAYLQSFRKTNKKP